MMVESCSVNQELRLTLPCDASCVWTESLEICVRRICRWHVPSNWSALDWRSEVQSVATLAAIEAEKVFDPARGVTREAFIRSRVLARALTFCRREWAYASRHVGSLSHPVNYEMFLPREPVAGPDMSCHPGSEILGDVLVSLPERSRWLIEALYLHKRTQADIARQLGITQRAVSKRKQALLRKLRHCIESAPGPQIHLRNVRTTAIIAICPTLSLAFWPW